MLKLDNVTISYKNVPTVQNFKRDMSKEQEDIKILQSFFEEFGYQAQSQIYVPQANEIMLEHNFQ